MKMHKQKNYILRTKSGEAKLWRRRIISLVLVQMLVLNTAVFTPRAEGNVACQHSEQVNTLAARININAHLLQQTFISAGKVEQVSRLLYKNEPFTLPGTGVTWQVEKNYQTSEPERRGLFESYYRIYLNPVSGDLVKAIEILRNALGDSDAPRARFKYIVSSQSDPQIAVEHRFNQDPQETKIVLDLDSTDELIKMLKILMRQPGIEKLQSYGVLKKTIKVNDLIQVTSCYREDFVFNVIFGRIKKLKKRLKEERLTEESVRPENEIAQLRDIIVAGVAAKENSAFVLAIEGQMLTRKTTFSELIGEGIGGIEKADIAVLNYNVSYSSRKDYVKDVKDAQRSKKLVVCEGQQITDALKDEVEPDLITYHHAGFWSRLGNNLRRSFLLSSYDRDLIEKSMPEGSKGLSSLGNSTVILLLGIYLFFYDIWRMIAGTKIERVDYERLSQQPNCMVLDFSRNQLGKLSIDELRNILIQKPAAKDTPEVKAVEKVYGIPAADTTPEPVRTQATIEKKSTSSIQAVELIEQAI